MTLYQNALGITHYPSYPTLNARQFSIPPHLGDSLEYDMGLEANL